MNKKTVNTCHRIHALYKASNNNKKKQLQYKVHVVGAMYIFCQKFQISIHTIHDFSIVVIM